MKKVLFFLLVAVGAVELMSCESETKNARIQVWLTDAPGDYEEVNVEIVGVEIHQAGGNQGSGWMPLDTKTGVYNLLELTNGLDTLIGELELPAGRISQIRLKLGNDNSIKVAGATFPLSTPSGQQRGLKLNVHQILQEGITYKVLLDFDAARSIVNQGNGGYALKPVIRTITEAQSGAIKGSVEPPAATPAVYAISGTDTVGTTYADESGMFLLRGIPAGTYTVVFLPNENYSMTSKQGVGVTTGSVTDLGVVQIEH
jgi:hypothetical protein